MDIKDKIDLAFRKIIQEEPELAKLFRHDSSPIMTFPDGLRLRFWRVYAGKREWKYCYSTTKNQNGKFTFWVYKPQGMTQWIVKSVREFKKRNAAKRCAQRQSCNHQAKLLHIKQAI